jgi:pyrimidine operon attenuation protein/uracil phosphoribosyltransferase
LRKPDYSLLPKLILDNRKLNLTIDRLCYQLIENHKDFANAAVIGIQPRGTHLADRVYRRLREITGLEIRYGLLDITFYRDDFRQATKKLEPMPTTIRFSTEGLKVVLIDDVLFSGRTVRAAMDALMDYGRPAKVELLVLIDRRFTREYPIQPDYVGRAIDSLTSERVKVEWKETQGTDQIWLVPAKSDQA